MSTETNQTNPKQVTIDAPNSTWNIPNTALGNFAKVFMNIGVVGIFAWIVLEAQHRNYHDMQLAREQMLEETKQARKDYRDDLKDVRARYDETRQMHLEHFQMTKVIYDYYTSERRPIRADDPRLINKKEKN